MLWVLYPGGSSRNLAPSPILGGGWAAPLSRVRVCAGRTCAPPGRCQGLHNGAPGMGTRPAHSAPNNHCSTAAGPAASRGGRTGGQQMGLGCQISSLGWGVQTALDGEGEGSGAFSPPHDPSQPLVPEGRWEGQGGGWRRLSAHHHCHLEQHGETVTRPGLGWWVSHGAGEP